MTGVKKLFAYYLHSKCNDCRMKYDLLCQLVDSYWLPMFPLTNWRPFMSNWSLCFGCWNVQFMIVLILDFCFVFWGFCLIYFFRGEVYQGLHSTYMCILLISLWHKIPKVINKCMRCVSVGTFIVYRLEMQIIRHPDYA